MPIGCSWLKRRKVRWSMKCKYDFVFLTNTPSFYKINLCNQIALTHTVLLVLYGYGSEAVNTQLIDKSDYRFDYLFLYEGDSSKRNKWITFFRLLQLMYRIQYQKVLYSGWFVPEYNLMSFLTSKRKNCVVCESSSIESHFAGAKGWVKKCIIRRMSVALPSGEPHKKIFEAIHFTGEIILTGGVGIFHKQPRVFSSLTHAAEKKYIYVGRLIDFKNVRFLVEVFNRIKKPLTIVGTGELSDELQSIANDNIRFLGFVDNEKLKDIYQAHDVFVLPSKSEPWGLVVEEAIYWGLPVIVSNHVGSARDMVEKMQTGCVFNYDNEDHFCQAIIDMEQNYEKYRQHVLEVDFNRRDKEQVSAYTNLVRNV